MIELEKTKIGVYTLKYENKYIHSKYDPIRESEQFAKSNMELIEKPLILVYGLGLGYHIDAIVKRMDITSKLYIFEWNKELIKYCKENNKNVFKYKNVKIFENNNEFYTNLSENLAKTCDIIIHKPSLETIKSSNQTLYNLLDDYSFLKQSLENGKEIIDIEEKNFEANKTTNYKPIIEFIHKFNYSDKPYVITSSGSSLDYELDSLKENRNKFYIIAVGSSLKALMDKQIRPDAIVIVDGLELVRKQFAGYEEENIPLLFMARASRWAVASYNGPKYMFNESNDNEIILRTGGTVAIPSMDVAVKCGAKKIILLGQDLAFIGEKSHVEAFEKMYDYKDDIKQNRKNVMTKGFDDMPVTTTKGYIRFKNRIELLIINNQNVKFINCSKGAFINGAEHMSFEECIKQI